MTHDDHRHQPRRPAGPADFADYLRVGLGWESVYAYITETFGPNGTLGRTSERDVVLVRASRRHHGRLTIQEYQALCPVANRRTLQRDLRELVEKGLLAPEGRTHRLQYLAGNGLR